MDAQTPTAERPFYPVKRDIVFRLFFADERNEDELIGFLKSVLSLPDDEYESITIADPHLLPEYVKGKRAVIDVKLHTKTRKTIHIEVQLQVSPPIMKNRVVFYDAKLITEQIGSGDKYKEIQQVVSIVITGEDLISDSPPYHHRFTFYDPKADVEFSDIIEIHTIELGKLPDDTDGTALYDWAKFIDAETEEELNMVEQRSPEVKRAAVKLRRMSAEENARYWIEQQEKWERDKSMWEDEFERRGMEKGLAEGEAKGRAEGRAEERKKLQSALADKDAALADKDAEIARLRAMLG